MIKYQNSLDGVTEESLQGFFVGWPKPPSAATHLKILQHASYIWLAIDTESGRVVGFVNAIADHVLSAYLPLVEVLPEYQFKGIGAELIRRMLETLKDYYMVDLVCDRNRQPGYKSLGMRPIPAMMVRNFDKQAGI
ncbi:MAG: GNAT family N-acetyltransferase [Candidatus Zixiibacteriota bacterium]